MLHNFRKFSFWRYHASLLKVSLKMGTNMLKSIHTYKYLYLIIFHSAYFFTCPFVLFSLLHLILQSNSLKYSYLCLKSFLLPLYSSLLFQVQSIILHILNKYFMWYLLANVLLFSQLWGYACHVCMPLERRNHNQKITM